MPRGPAKGAETRLGQSLLEMDKWNQNVEEIDGGAVTLSSAKAFERLQLQVVTPTKRSVWRVCGGSSADFRSHPPRIQVVGAVEGCGAGCDWRCPRSSHTVVDDVDIHVSGVGSEAAPKVIRKLTEMMQEEKLKLSSTERRQRRKAQSFSRQIGGWETAKEKPGNRVPCVPCPCRAFEAVGGKCACGAGVCSYPPAAAALPLAALAPRCPASAPFMFLHLL